MRRGPLAVVVALLLLPVSPLRAQSANGVDAGEPIGRVTAAFGVAAVYSPEGIRKGDLHTLIENGDRIRTNGGGVTVLLASRVVLKIDHDTTVTVNESPDQLNLVLERGTVHVFVGERPLASGIVCVQDPQARVETLSGVFLASYNPDAKRGYYACEHSTVSVEPRGKWAIPLVPDKQLVVADGEAGPVEELDRIAFQNHKVSLERLGQSVKQQATDTFRMRTRLFDTQIAINQLSEAGWINREMLAANAQQQASKQGSKSSEESSEESSSEETSTAAEGGNNSPNNGGNESAPPADAPEAPQQPAAGEQPVVVEKPATPDTPAVAVENPPASETPAADRPAAVVVADPPAQAPPAASDTAPPVVSLELQPANDLPQGKPAVDPPGQAIGLDKPDKVKPEKVKPDSGPTNPVAVAAIENSGPPKDRIELGIDQPVAAPPMNASIDVSLPTGDVQPAGVPINDAPPLPKLDLGNSGSSNSGPGNDAPKLDKPNKGPKVDVDKPGKGPKIDKVKPDKGPKVKLDVKTKSAAPKLDLAPPKDLDVKGGASLPPPKLDIAPPSDIATPRSISNVSLPANVAPPSKGVLEAADIKVPSDIGVPKLDIDPKVGTQLPTKIDLDLKTPIDVPTKIDINPVAPIDLPKDLKDIQPDLSLDAAKDVLSDVVKDVKVGDALPAKDVTGDVTKDAATKDVAADLPSPKDLGVDLTKDLDPTKDLTEVVRDAIKDATSHDDGATTTSKKGKGK